MRAGTLQLRLVARRARWHPDADDGPSLEIDALGEEGRAPQVPAPLIRVRAGTPVHATVRNELDDTLLVFPMCAVACARVDTPTIAPGATRDVRFTPGEPGTYTYYAATRRAGKVAPLNSVQQLGGAIVVDPVAGPVRPDRVFAINTWIVPWKDKPGERLVMTLNGKMWPHTERLRYSVGDSVQWRIVNVSGDAHPMHLHGFYFRITARGDGAHQTRFPADSGPFAVTENVEAGGTFDLLWQPVRAGRWLFHCHKGFHVTGQQHRDLTGVRDSAIDATSGYMVDPPLDSSASPSHASMHDPVAHLERAMGGLVMGIDVGPASGGALGTIRPGPDASPAVAPRKLRLVAQRRAGYYGKDEGMGFVLQNEAKEPARDSIMVPGPPLVLRRGQPVEINVVNHLSSATGVHWHGIELESYFDGVPGWSGSADRPAPLIAPRDSFTVRFTPPRAGTFIYHTHARETRQLGAGLYGAIVVLDSGVAWNDTTDHLLILGQGGENLPGLIVVNGLPAGPESVLRAGVPHRFRVIDITVEDEVDLSLVSDSMPVQWRPMAKDGAELPPSQSRLGPARVHLGPGETFDFEFTPARGEYRLQFLGYSNVLLTLRAR
jgi:FtsP/CotA-like multicopper oxidase with cupredoxin domain